MYRAKGRTRGSAGEENTELMGDTGCLIGTSHYPRAGGRNAAAARGESQAQRTRSMRAPSVLLAYSSSRFST